MQVPEPQALPLAVAASQSHTPMVEERYYDLDCWAARTPAAMTRTSAIVKTVATFLINSSAFRRGFHKRILRAGKNANEN